MKDVSLSTLMLFSPLAAFILILFLISIFILFMFVIILIVFVLGGLPLPTQTLRIIDSSDAIYTSKSSKVDMYKCAFAEEPIHHGDVAILYSWDANAAHLVLYSLTYKCTYLRVKDAGTWGSWQKVSTDIPPFYKNYSDISSLIGGINNNKNTAIGMFSTGETKTITNALYKLLLISANTNGIWAIILCQQMEYSIVAKGTRWDNFFDVAYGDATLSLTSKDSISSGVWYSIL